MEIPKEDVWLGWLWAALLAFHVTVFYYVAAQVYQKNQRFKSIFFKLYLLHSISNYGVVATFLLLNLDACTTSWGSACFEVVAMAYYFMPFLQQFSYTAIACNRFSAIVIPLRHERIWKPFSVWLLLIPMIMLSMACASVRLVQRTILLWQYDITFEYAARQAGWTRAGVTSLVYVACFLVDAVLELWTFVAYHRLDFVGKRNHNEDYRLLVYTLLGMTMNSFLVTYYGGIVLDLICNDVMDTIASIVIHLQALVGPVFLMLTSKTVRLGYFEFYGLRTPERRQITVFTTSPKNTAA